MADTTGGHTHVRDFLGLCVFCNSDEPTPYAQKLDELVSQRDAYLLEHTRLTRVLTLQSTLLDAASDEAVRLLERAADCKCGAMG